MPAAKNRYTDDPTDRFRVEPWVDMLGAMTERWPKFWRALGDLESRRLRDALERIEITAPIFVCGLARSGTTILLECLAAHPETASHRYRDYPGVLAPIVWDRIAARLYGGAGGPIERAHGDGIAVTPDSPEAVAEMLWMAFHTRTHDPSRDNRIGRGDLDPDFADFFRDHIRKLLWCRNGRRYLSKGNYDLARLGALIELFPDARFIVPVRDPVTHIASLVRQQARFSAGETRHPAARRYMRRIGHFEFGLDRRPINVGNTDVTAEIQRLWRDGREVDGWSLYWSDVHGFLADQIEGDSELGRAILPVGYEALCRDPRRTLERIFAHAALSAPDPLMTELSARIRSPRHGALPFDAAAQRTIRAATSAAFDRISRLVRRRAGDQPAAGCAATIAAKLS